MTSVPDGQEDYLKYLKFYIVQIEAQGQQSSLNRQFRKCIPEDFKKYGSEELLSLKYLRAGFSRTLLCIDRPDEFSAAYNKLH